MHVFMAGHNVAEHNVPCQLMYTQSIQMCLPHQNLQEILKGNGMIHFAILSDIFKKIIIVKTFWNYSFTSKVGDKVRKLIISDKIFVIIILFLCPSHFLFQVRFSIGAGDRQSLQPPLSDSLPFSRSTVAMLAQQIGKYLYNTRHALGGRGAWRDGAHTPHRFCIYIYRQDLLYFVLFSNLIFIRVQKYSHACHHKCAASKACATLS